MVSSCCLLTWCTNSMVDDTLEYYVSPICTIKSKVHLSTGKSKKTRLSCGTGFKTNTESHKGQKWLPETFSLKWKGKFIQSKRGNLFIQKKKLATQKGKDFDWKRKIFLSKGGNFCGKRGNFCNKRGKLLVQKEKYFFQKA